MPTREQVTAAIKAIEDNGNNTALEVRNTLTALLEFTETVPKPLPPGNTKVPYFQIGSGEDPVDMEEFALWYSFKGIKGQTVNFTFKLMVREQDITNFEVEIPSNLSKILKEIVEPRDDDTPIDFAVPILNTTAENGEAFYKIGAMRIDVSRENELHLFLEGVDKVRGGDSIFTSVHFHAPKFNFKNRG